MLKHALWSRYRPLGWLAGIFVGLSTLTRLALLIATRDGIPGGIGDKLFVFGMGLVYDLAAFTFFAWPMVLLLWLLPQRAFNGKVGRGLVGALCYVLLFVLLFIAGAEWTFWEEFQTRFNFIAVDYLVYTNEVIGNIQESYPIGKIVAGMFVLATGLFLLTRRWRRAQDTATTFKSRSLVTLGWLVASVLFGFALDSDMKERTGNEYVNQLAGNGIFEFFAAARAAELSYPRFYKSVPDDVAFTQLRTLLQTPDAKFVGTDPMDITRDITADKPKQKLNVVLISVESLSAFYSGAYGGKPSLTPELDKLADQSLLFTQLYANGTRTVRGLEALALSIPPTPGESIVKRPNNEGLFSMATVFNQEGYESQFLYGGYGAFDNMDYFFAHNGYVVRDRGEIPPKEIHAANIWGVADEDLYTLSIKEFDRIHAEGKPFFGHIMTTSNHRPYTFPTGRVDAPQKKRSSAIRYTDWSIGDFLRRARDKPWFDDTVFIITADHCAASGGIASLPVFRYHIPMWIYSPKHVTPAHVDRMMSQIDIGPTLFGMLGMSYRSRFFGNDIFRLEPGRERAFIGNYQRLGYLRQDQLIELGPNRQVTATRPDYEKNSPQPTLPLDPTLESEAITYYQTASYLFSHGMLGADRAKSAPPAK